MAIPRGLGSFDPTLTTKFGPTGTEEIDALNRGIQLGMREGNEIARLGYMRRREQRDIQAAKELSDVRAAQRYKIHSEQKEGLFFQPTKNIDGINAARAEVSTMLVDKANQLFQEREKGNLSATEYAKGMAFLEGQIPLYKTAEETIRVNAEKYLEGVANGTLSNINDPKVESWWGAVADGTASLRYATTKDGQIVITGEWDDPTDDIKGKVQVPLADIEKMAVVKYQPKEDVQTFRKASTDSMVAAKISNSIANGTSKEQLLSEIGTLKLDKKNPEKTVTTVFGNNFDEYLEGLGDGDEVDQVAQYVMDGGANNYYRSQMVLDKVIENLSLDKNKFDDLDTKGDLEELIKLGKLEDYKEALKQDYIDSAVNEYNYQLEEKLTGVRRDEKKQERDELKRDLEIKEIKSEIKTGGSTNTKTPKTSKLFKDLVSIEEEAAKVFDVGIEEELDKNKSPYTTNMQESGKPEYTPEDKLEYLTKKYSGIGLDIEPAPNPNFNQKKYDDYKGQKKSDGRDAQAVYLEQNPKTLNDKFVIKYFKDSVLPKGETVTIDDIINNTLFKDLIVKNVSKSRQN